MGNIIVERDAVTNGITGHAAIVEGTFYSSPQSKYYIRVVEAVALGVKRGILDDTRINDKSSVVKKLNINSGIPDYNEIKGTAAANWALGQRDKPYNLHTPAGYSSGQSNWYCSELVWAAYRNQGINLYTSPSLNFILPYTLRDSGNLATVNI